MKKTKSVEAYISGHPQWQKVLMLLRDIMQSTEMDETLKWGIPVYTIDGKNVAGLAAFKQHIAIWFYQGALLKDEKNKLINAQEGTTKALRQWRFTSVEEVQEEKANIKAYAEEAIANQKQGKAIKPVKKKSLHLPNELQTTFSNNPELQKAFESFSLSKKREFADYISEAKRAETRQKRLDKITPMILQGIGLHDKYRR